MNLNKIDRRLSSYIIEDIRNLRKDINKLKYIFINDNSYDVNKIKRVLKKVEEIEEILDLKIHIGE